MIERQLMVRSVVGSIPHGEPIELFLDAASVPNVMVCVICLSDVEYKITLAANRKE